MKMRAEDEVERLLSQATAERARGNFLAARRLLEQALEKAPNRADIYEMLGDVYRGVADLEAALTCYRRAHELAPERKSAEEKLADTLLALNPPPPLEEVPFLPKNPNLAVAFSAVLPGAGQIYNEQWLKGIVMMGITFLALGYFLQFYHQIRAKMLLPSLEQVQRQLEQASMGEILLVLLAGLTAFAVWTWSILDAYLTARRYQQLRQKPTAEGGQSS